MMKKKNISRRDFLKDSAALAATGSLYLNLPPKLFAQSEQKTRVVLIRHKNLLNDKNIPDDAILQEMLDQAVTALVDEVDPIKAWKQFIQSNDIVGIKTNVWSYLRTPPELEKAIKKRVLDCGVVEKNISINDRGILSDPVFKKVTALINVRPMRTHHWSGVGTLLKNYIMFVNKPYEYHGDTCADLAAIWKLPHVQGRTRLNILVMFTPLFHSVGPHDYSAEYIWKYQGLLVGFDPVAVDATGVRIIQAKRREYFKEDRPINPPVKHIFLADTRHHLGTADPNKIELIKLGWQDGVLI
ncbi:MAG: hypothetical protein A2Y94_07190 [Caldithrix sp. RBG_13_44_9]|nr:MAG: hypothetical protein A2Y94_07190 [Caldithrix sp. RBG_13_44_9]